MPTRGSSMLDRWPCVAVVLWLAGWSTFAVAQQAAGTGPAVGQEPAPRSEDSLPEPPPDPSRRRWFSPLFQAQSRDSPAVRRASRDVILEARLATVEVFASRKRLALGTIVDPQGYILTKSSQLTENVQCRLSDDRQVAAEIVGRDARTDLAMLKVDAEPLPAIRWSERITLPVGTLVVTPGIGETPLAFGIVSVPPRRIQGPEGILGVLLEQDNQGPRIAQILPGSGAAEAGLRIDDIILRVDGTRIASRDRLQDLLHQLRAGDQLQLSLLRDGDLLSVTAQIGARQRFDPAARRAQLQNSLGGPLSTRRTRFPLALQHDSFLEPNDCGGPLVDLTGTAVGINIARAGRVSSLALPVEIVQPLIEELKSGKLAPTRSRQDES